MVKTTLYLPEDLKHRIERAARDDKQSEAEFIRAALTTALNGRTPPKPHVGIFASDNPDYANKMDEYMVGFGED